MAINKVEYGGNTLIDITDTTATSSDVASGEVFYNADGTRGVGTLTMGNAKNYYGTCSTKNSTQAKVVDCTGFVLETGATIDIKFTNAQTYNGVPTLNINSTGAVSITGGLKGMWASGDVVRFVYDGSTYRVVSIPYGSTATFGAVMLSTDLTSTATNRAATISTVHQAYDLADGKQDAITSTNKLDYSLLDNTPTIPTVPTTLSSFTDDLGSSPTHSHSQYLTSYTETDPVFSASASAGISSSDITNWNGKQTAPTVLYNNTSGTTSSITTLSDNLSNYSYIEIFYGWDTGDFGILSTRYDLSSSYEVNLSTMVFNNNYIYFGTSKWTASGTNLTLSGGEYWRGRVATQSAFTRTQSNNVAVFKVLGYK